MKYLSDKDILAGLMFVSIGLLGLGLSNGLAFGTTSHPGPGFFPVVLSLGVVAIGLGVAGRAVVRATGPVPAFAWRPFFLITLAVVLFALVIERMGLVPAVLVATLTGQLRRPRLWHPGAAGSGGGAGAGLGGAVHRRPAPSHPPVDILRRRRWN